jgi:fibronectin-binding autotransporter adhesin
MFTHYPSEFANENMKNTLKNPLFHLQTCLILAILFSATTTAPAAQAVWQAIVGTSTDTNWSDSANWQGATPPTGNNCVFNDATGVGNNSTINNVVDTPEFPTALLYTNIGTFQNTLILPGDTLTIGTGGLTLGNTTAFGANPASAPTTTISGNTLVASNDTVSVGYSYQAATGGTIAVLNMAGLNDFVGTNLNRITVGVGSTRIAGNLYLAATNQIYFTGASSSSSPNLDIGDNSGNNGPGAALYLGATNAIYVNDIGMGLKKQESGGGGQILFNTAFNSPVVYFYGTNGPGSAVSTWAIGDGQSTGGTTTCAGTADFTGGTVYANVNNMWLGRSSSAESGGSPTSAGTLTFAAGQINVHNMTNGWITSAKEPATTAESTINVNGTAVLNVTGNLVLATTNSGLTYGSDTVEAQAELFINSGTVRANQIITGGNGNSGNGYGAYIQMTGGSLAVTNSAGSAAFPLNYLVLSGSATLDLGVADNVTNVQVQDLDNADASTTLINISSIPVVPAYPTQYPILAYQGGTGSGATFALGTLPGTYTGFVSNDNSTTVWLVVTNGPVLPKLCQWGGGVNGNWDTTTLNWTNNGVAVAYNENDSVLFNDQAQTATINLTAPHTPFEWTVTNDILNYIFTGSGVQGGVSLVKSGTASLTLSESGDNFNGGISALGGTLVLDQSGSTISGGLVIAPGATVQIGNNDANGALPGGPLSNSGTLVYDQTVSTTLSTALSGSGSLTQEGTGTLALSGANTYTGNTLVSAGTLALTSGASIAGSAAVTVNNATLDLSAETSVTLNNLSLANATLDVNVGYSSTPVSVANLTLGGSANTINIAALPPIAGYPATIPLVQSATAVSGSDITLGTLPAATPSYAGSVTVSGDQVVLTLTAGPVGVRPYVIWSGADVANLHTNWSDASNWQAPGAPTAADNAIFTETAAQSASALSTPGGGPGALNFAAINNIVDANFTISSLIYTNVGGTYQNTFIANGDTLTISNTNTSGTLLSAGSANTDFGASATGNVTISGPNGTLDVDNTNDTVFVGLVTAGTGTELGTLDMSGLGSFNASVSSFAVGALASTAFGTIATAYLAQTNVITAFGGTNNESGQDETMSFMVGESGKGGAGECFLYLGQQNTINANYIGVSLAKEPAELEFNPTWSNPSVTIRGADGVSPVAVWAIGDALAQSGGSTEPIGIADFTGGTVNALVKTMYIGRSPNASGPHAATGTLAFDAGTFAAGTIYDGYQAFGTSDNGVGAINVGGTGQLQVGTLNLAWTTSGEASPTTGALNITNGTAQLGAVVCDSHAAGQSTINLVNGTLVITNTAGVTGAPLTALNLTGGALQLDVNGTANVTNIVATAVTTSGTTALSIGSLTGVTTGVTYPLISYTGTDPFSSLSLSLPAGYNGTLVDNPGVVGLQLTASSSAAPRFTSISITGTTLNIAGTNGVANGSFILLETTNLAPPVHWTPAITNSYNANGAFNVSATLNAGTPDEFFTLTNVP